MNLANTSSNAFENSASKRILVTGGRGFIGSHLVRVLRATGANVVSVDIADGGVSEILSYPGEVTLDIRDRNKMDELFDVHKFCTVFDLASFTDAGLSKFEYVRNVTATDVMTSLAAKHRVEKYTFFSTQFVHRRPGEAPSSDIDFQPTEAYGESKVESELLVRGRLEVNNWLILRPSYVWGPGLARFRDGLLKRLAQGLFLVPNDPVLTRYYGYVDTVVGQAISLTFGNGEAGRVYYVSDDAINLHEFCDTLVLALGHGGYRSVPVSIIRAAGLLGDMLSGLGVRPPISNLQAVELTTRFPIPLAPTLAATRISTQLSSAAEAVVSWARTDPTFPKKVV